MLRNDSLILFHSVTQELLYATSKLYISSSYTSWYTSLSYTSWRTSSLLLKRDRLQKESENNESTVVQTLGCWHRWVQAYIMKLYMCVWYKLLYIYVRYAGQIQLTKRKHLGNHSGTPLTVKCVLSPQHRIELELSHSTQASMSSMRLCRAMCI